MTRLQAERPGAGIFSLRYCVQTGSGAHSASFPVCTGGKVAGAWSWPLSWILCRG